MAVAAPAIKAEMDDWVAIGGGNSGIVADNYVNHPTGFHRSANEVPVTDYSRRRDPNGPSGPFSNWSWSCAGDFAHNGEERLRAMHRQILARLMANDPALSMICEFIGQPWADRPVMYWARWEGYQNLRLYTGKGHDKWSHFSWYRSRAHQRAYLWNRSGAMTYCKHGDKGDDVGRIQLQLKYSGVEPELVWDNDYGDKTATAVKKLDLLFNDKKSTGKSWGPMQATRLDLSWSKHHGVDVAAINRLLTDLSTRVANLEKRSPSGLALPATVTVAGGTLRLDTA